MLTAIVIERDSAAVDGRTAHVYVGDIGVYTQLIEDRDVISLAEHRLYIDDSRDD